MNALFLVYPALFFTGMLCALAQGDLGSTILLGIFTVLSFGIGPLLLYMERK